METPNTASLARRWSELGASEPGLIRVFRTFNANAAAFRKESEAHDDKTRTIKVDYLARVEGEGRLHVRVKGDRVAEVRLQIFEPPRFFEAFLRGRAYEESRISPRASAASVRSPIR